MESLMTTFTKMAFIILAFWIITAGLGLTDEPVLRRVKKAVERPAADGSKWNSFQAGAVDDDMNVLNMPSAFGN